jgi:hypothetical protein
MESAQAVYQTYSFRELVRIFQDAGFEVMDNFGSLTNEPFQLGSPSLWLVARRP